MTMTLKPFFEPKAVAIIGASASPEKLSYGILKNMLEYGYQGEIYPVNPKSDQILGLTCYKDISDLPDLVDLAVVVLPAQIIPSIIEACGKKGIKAVTVISGGFREVGSQGKGLESEVIEIAKKHHILIIGPNCVGTMNLITGLNTTFINGMPAKGGIGFISQSGAVCGGIVNHVQGKGVGFSHFLSLGNEADVDETDMIEYLGDDVHTKVIAAYIEGIQDGQKFLRISKSVTRKKPLVILKAGRSEEGARAVSSHTGSLAGSHVAYRAAFQQAGAIEVYSVLDLLNVSMALDWLEKSAGKNVAIITNSGGPAALASDSLAQYHLSLATLGDDSSQALRTQLNPAAQVENPVDMLGGANEDEYAHALKIVIDDPHVDMVLAILVPTSLVDTEAVARSIAQAKSGTNKPVIACFMGSDGVVEARRILHGKHVPMVDYPELTGVMFSALASRIENTAEKEVQEIKTKSVGYANVKNIIKSQNRKKIWGEYDTRPLLAEYGISLIPAVFISHQESLQKTVTEFEYPLVVKIVSEDILHKSDSGGIKVGINNEDELEEAFNEIAANIKRHQPEARIEGFLVEKMAPPGQEIIIGMKRDPGFGPLMMFGMGGIFVELFKDVSFRIAPLDCKLAVKMIEETKAYKLLSGFRGGLIYDLGAICENLIKLSQLSADFPQIQEIEINPLLVLPEGQGALALDCRMITD